MTNGQKHPRRASEAGAIGISLSKGTGRPLFLQLHEQIIDRIAAGELTAGTRLPPVRRLAAQLGINHMTVAKAYKDLAEAGFVEGQNVAIEFRSAEDQNDRLPALVADLIRWPVAVIVGNGVAAIVVSRWERELDTVTLARELAAGPHRAAPAAREEVPESRVISG